MNIAVLQNSSGVKQLICYGYVPFLFVFINGLIVSTVFYLPATLAIKGLCLIALMVIAIAASFLAERVLPYRAEWNKSHDGDSRRDYAHFFCNELLSIGPALLAPLVFVLALDKPGEYWPAQWPIVLQLFLVLLVFDLISTVFHWLAHV